MPYASIHGTDKGTFWGKLRESGVQNLDLFGIKLEVDPYERAWEAAMEFFFIGMPEFSRHAGDAGDQQEWLNNMKGLVNSRKTDNLVGKVVILILYESIAEGRLALTYVLTDRFYYLLYSCLEERICAELLRLLVSLGGRLTKANEELPDLRNKLSVNEEMPASQGFEEDI